MIHEQIFNHPTWEDVCKKYLTIGAYILCSCDQVLQTVEQTKEHWQRGHFN